MANEQAADYWIAKFRARALCFTMYSGKVLEQPESQLVVQAEYVSRDACLIVAGQLSFPGI